MGSKQLSLASSATTSRLREIVARVGADDRLLSPTEWAAAIADPTTWRYRLERDRAAAEGHLTAFIDAIDGMADPPTYYAFGTSPEDAIGTFAETQGWTDATIGEAIHGGDDRYTWGFHWRADGTSMKAAGWHVPGGVVLTWWK